MRIVFKTVIENNLMLLLSELNVFCILYGFHNKKIAENQICFLCFLCSFYFPEQKNSFQKS